MTHNHTNQSNAKGYTPTGRKGYYSIMRARTSIYKSFVSLRSPSSSAYVEAPPTIVPGNPVTNKHQ